jgi:hypothetical protein
MGLLGCNPKSSTSAISSDVTISGYRTSARVRDGVTRKLGTGADVEIQSGHVTKFPKVALVKLQKSGGPQPHIAELRENAEQSCESHPRWIERIEEIW